MTGGSAAGREVPGTLILLGTPIGNLSDISERTIKTLESADVVVAEDSRRARILLSHLGIAKKDVLTVDANRERVSVDRVIGLLRGGKTVVYTTDAGMPGVSDPGSVLVRNVALQGFRVEGVPGPSAVILAASMSGLCERGFLFAGFPPVKAGPRSRFLSNLASFPYATIVFESPKRIGDLLLASVEVFGAEHPIFVGRELTKVHQELFYGDVGSSHSRFAGEAQRGEFTVVFAAVEQDSGESAKIQVLKEIIESLRGESGGTKEAAERIAGLAGVSKGAVYQLILAGSKRPRETS